MIENINYIEQKKNNHLFFNLGNSKYAVNSANVVEIMKLPMLDYPQKLPNNIIGLLKYGNFVINVVDIRFYLDIDVTGYTVDSELLILKTDETIFGIVVDKVLGIESIDASGMDSIPFVDNKTIIDSIYKKDDETIFIVNIYSIENRLRQTIKSEDIDISLLFPKDESSVAVMRNRTLAMIEKNNMVIAGGELRTKKKLISFDLNNDLYCISLDYVKEVLKDTQITKVPGTPDFIEGIMNLRGDYITVLNLKKFLNIPVLASRNESEKKPVIVVSCNDMELAFYIDKINELFEIVEEKIINSVEGYFSSEFILNDISYTILNVEKIFTDKKIIITDM